MALGLQGDVLGRTEPSIFADRDHRVSVMQGWVYPGLHPLCAADTLADASPGPEHAALPEGGHKIGTKRSRGRGHPKGGGWEKRWKEIMPLLRCEKRSSYYSYCLCCSSRISVKTPLF